MCSQRILVLIGLIMLHIYICLVSYMLHMHVPGLLVWGSVISRKRVEFLCDNRSLVEAITKGSSIDKTVMHLLRCLRFFHVTASHLSGVENTTADQLSRNQLKQFLISHPLACRIPTSIPLCLTRVVSPTQLDPTSPQFLRHFKQVTQMP